MYKIAAFGDYNSIYGFSTIGLTLFSTDGKKAEEIARLLRTAAENEYGVIYMTESVMRLLGDELEKYAARMTPAIIAIPDASSLHASPGDSLGITQVKKSVEQAVGSDILFQDS